MSDQPTAVQVATRSMEFAVLTVLPELFESFFAAGIFGRARERGQVHARTVFLRDFAEDRHRTVDDYPYGGGAGMILKVDPIARAIQHTEQTAQQKPLRILLAAHGTPFTQADATRYAQHGSLAFICGRYEGVDERVRHYIDEEVSIGDYVLMGGEIGAMVIMEAVARLVPGVLGNSESAITESYTSAMDIEYPQYTRPPIYDGHAVPDILLSGDHARVERFRREQALERQARRQASGQRAEATKRPLEET